MEFIAFSCSFYDINFEYARNIIVCIISNLDIYKDDIY